ncbi:MAG: NAD(P)-binding protein, partial [Anaeromyxobacteraceae bacterium]
MEAPVREAFAVVLGTGFSGLAAAAALDRAGVRDVVLLERSSALGGTWRDNQYPGCACDVP